jgi:hypothetical protein
MKERQGFINFSRKIQLRLIWVCLQYSFFLNASYSQSDPFYWMQNNTEVISERPEMENEYRLMMETMEERKLHPVNLNSATIGDLERIPILTSLQRKNLAVYLHDYGEVFSLYELLAVPGFDSSFIMKLSSYIDLLPSDKKLPLTIPNLSKYGRHEFVIQSREIFPASRGYLCGDTLSGAGGTRYYPGNPLAVQFRYSFSFSDRLMIGISGDKDAGENFFKGAQKKGMDYYSGYLCLGFRHYLKRLIIGNFRTGSGLGLTLSNGTAMGLYPSFITEFHQAGESSPSQSAMESSNLRGIAADLSAGRFSMTAFCSYRKRDANVLSADSISGKALTFSSFIETGYHRTNSELADKARVSETLKGGHLNFRGNFFSLGATAYAVSYDVLYEAKHVLYNKFAFTGQYNSATGIDFQAFYRFIRVAGEISRSWNGSIAWITYLNLSPDPRFDLFLLCRNYPAAYQNLFSSSFSQGSKCQDENGLFMCLSAALPFHFTLSAYADCYRFPWATFLVDYPSAGYETGLQLSYKASKAMTLLARYVRSSREAVVSGNGDMVQKTGISCQDDFRFQMNLQAGESLMLQSRVEIKKGLITGSGTHAGFLAFQDVSWKPVRYPLKLSLRFALFDCPFYDTRVSAYEPDVRYGYSMPSYYGNGISACSVIQYKVLKHCVVSCKGAIYEYNGKDIIGSGLDQIDSNWKLDLTVQLELRI